MVKVETPALGSLTVAPALLPKSSIVTPAPMKSPADETPIVPPVTALIPVRFEPSPANDVAVTTPAIVFVSVVTPVTFS